MVEFDRRGQCSLELALTAAALTLAVLMVRAVWPIEKRGFGQTQLSRGRP